MGKHREALACCNVLVSEKSQNRYNVTATFLLRFCRVFVRFSTPVLPYDTLELCIGLVRSENYD
jgi:hypothetical protein